MKYIVLAWLYIGVFWSSLAQTIQVIDHTSLFPLTEVKISGENQSWTTDHNGMASLQSTADSLAFNKLGYEGLRISRIDLVKWNYIVKLEKSTVIMKEVIVSSFQQRDVRQTSIQISTVSPDEMSQQGIFTLTDALAKVPGVNQLSTGIGISKPVIRGLYGNRVLVLLSGLRFDNQQWQDEHGMGLSEVGISKVEITKGPMSVLYGSDAVGGVLNIFEELPPQAGTTESDAQMTLHSNTLGGTLQAGIKSNHGKYWYRVRLATTNHADYVDGNQVRVLNSRFNNYVLKTTFGFNKDHWTSENYYQFSQSQFGFVFSDIGQFFEPDSRWSRSMSGPHHMVMLNMFSSLNQVQLKNSTLDWNLGLQSNLRSEDEGGGELSLKMHLMTGQYALKWSKSIGDHTTLTIANYSLLENNQNLGRRKIVPNALTLESNLSILLRHPYQHFAWEYGVGAGARLIQTNLTPTVNTDEKDIDPFSQIRTFGSGMMGTTYSPNSHWQLKANISTGVRTPNLLELSANGLHEGIYTYELGNPDMKNERNQNVDLGIQYTGNQLYLSLSGFYNQFQDYIYLTPTDNEWFGFPVYKFVQSDARLYGYEAQVGFSPKGVKGFKMEVSCAGLIGQLTNGNYLPYMPAQKIKPEIRYDKVIKGWTAFAYVNADLVLAQKKLNYEEKTTPAYQLINSGLGFSRATKRADYTVSLSGNNWLNQDYFDHLSRFKNFGLLNVGRDISLQLKINFNHQLKTQ